MPNTERFRPGFLRRVLLFTAPCGVIVVAAALTSFQLAQSAGEIPLNAQCAATTALFIVTMAVLLQSARPLNLRIDRRAYGRHVPGRAVHSVVLQLLRALLGPERYAVISIGVGLVGASLVWAATLVTDRWRRA